MNEQQLREHMVHVHLWGDNWLVEPDLQTLVNAHEDEHGDQFFLTIRHEHEGQR